MAFTGQRRRSVVAVWAVLATGAIAHAEPPASAARQAAEPVRSADELVRQAVRSRAIGDGDSTALLERARATDPRSGPAHWLSGFVRESGGWLKFDAVADADAYRQILDRYETRRLTQPDTLAGHAAMAGWCGQQRLPMQERAHWFKVLELDADHATARAQLGFVRLGSKWVARSEVENTRRRKIGTEQAFKKWSTALKPIRTAFESGDPARMAAARQKLAAIRDPDAIPAMEAVLSRLNLDASSAVVSTIRGMSGPDAAVGLARQAVFADWYPAGKEAAEALRDHHELSYVPLLLSGLATPPGDSFKVTTVAGAEPGRLLVRYEFERERRDQTEKVTYDVSYGVWTGASLPASNASSAGMRVVQVPGPPSAIVTSRTTPPTGRTRVPDRNDERRYYDEILGARVDVDQENVAARVEEESRATKELNSRICRALRAATAQNPEEAKPDDPRTWWEWWSKRREIVLAGQKPVNYSSFVSEAVEVAPNYRRLLVLPVIPEPPPPPPGSHMSCLVAGTLIRTDVGLRPVEQIRLGDRVLSQNVDTGELAYRVVLQPTVRESAPTVILKFGERKIRTTTGHSFWAVGRGWTMAREFAPGMRMAAVVGTVEVTGMEPGADAPVHNLVVDEFHTYFVGDDLVLSHDVLPPEPAQGGLPGKSAR